jgi:hypothetical protein
VLPRHPAPKVLEIREQSNIPVLLLTEAASELFNVVAGEPMAATLGLHGFALP